MPLIIIMTSQSQKRFQTSIHSVVQVTTPEDLLLAEKLIAEAEEQRAQQPAAAGAHAVHVHDLTLQQV